MKYLCLAALTALAATSSTVQAATVKKDLSAFADKLSRIVDRDPSVRDKRGQWALSEVTKREEAIKHSFIVELDRAADSPSLFGELEDLVASLGCRVQHTYDTPRYLGLSVQCEDADLPAEFYQLPYVVGVEEDQLMHTSLQTQTDNVPWGLDRIDQALGVRNLDGVYKYSFTGQGVKVFVVDSGTQSNHIEFTGRMDAGYTAIADNRGSSDCNGHGTHVGGTATGTTLGIAKKATVVPVRVMNCDGSGSLSNILKGLDYIINLATTNKAATLPAVANLSIGGSKNPTLDSRVNEMIDAGVATAVAAGNENADACNYSPSGPKMVSVAASSDQDIRASFSNYGNCTDLFAPGQSVLAAYYDETRTDRIATLSGTSMAAPHVAGVMALMLEQNPALTPADLKTLLLSQTSLNQIADVKGSPNKVLQAPIVTATQAPTTTAPITTTGPTSPGDTTTPTTTAPDTGDNTGGDTTSPTSGTGTGGSGNAPGTQTAPDASSGGPPMLVVIIAGSVASVIAVGALVGFFVMRKRRENDRLPTAAAATPSQSNLVSVGGGGYDAGYGKSPYGQAPPNYYGGGPPQMQQQGYGAPQNNSYSSPYGGGYAQ